MSDYTGPGHRHTHEWGRFIVHARTHRDAARLAAQRGWWLHCWRWQEKDVATPEVEENLPPAPHATWEDYVEYEDQRFLAARERNQGAGLSGPPMSAP